MMFAIASIVVGILLFTLAAIDRLRKREAKPPPEEFDGFDYEYSLLKSAAMKGMKL